MNEYLIFAVSVVAMYALGNVGISFYFTKGDKDLSKMF